MSSSSFTNCWAFDIDGVLVDSKTAVRRAYELAGVVQPESAWGQPWKDWLPLVSRDPAEVRALKAEYYMQLIERGQVPRLPMADFALRLERDGHRVAYVTSSSDPSATAILKSLELDHTCLLGTELEPVERARKLKAWGDYGCYVDDRVLGLEIAHDAGWSFMLAVSNVRSDD